MRAQVLREFCEIEINGQPRKLIDLPLKSNPLEMDELPEPIPGVNQIVIKVSACGVCHTEIDEIEGRVRPKLPVILGHEVVGRVESIGKKVTKFKKGDRVGIAWIYYACGKCSYCLKGNENLCPEFKGTGCDVNGGYAEYAVVSANFAYPIPANFTDSQAAPLLCAGAIGYRALNLTKMQDDKILGLYGFGASAHIVIQVAKYKYPNAKVFVFTRPGQKEHQELAKKLGADWVGSTGDTPPVKLNCAIDFTPAWSPVVEAMRALEKGGRVVINAIRKEERDKNYLLKLNYSDCIWQEKELKSVANITRTDAQEFLNLSAKVPIIPTIQEFKLEEASRALILLKQAKIQGAAVLRM